MSFSPQMLRRNITPPPRVYNRAVRGGPFPALLGTRSGAYQVAMGLWSASSKSSNFFSSLRVQAAATARSHRNLRADLDHAPGRNVEKVGGVARRFGQADE